MPAIWESLRELWAIPAARAAVIVLGTTLAAMLIKRLLRAGFGAANRRLHLHLPDAMVDAVQRPAFLTVLAGGVGWAAVEAGLPKPLIYVLDGTLQSFAIALWVYAFMGLGSAALLRIARRHRPNALLQRRTLPLFDIALKISVAGLGLYLVFLAWHIDLTAWLASAGVLGIALGFGAKDSLANLFAGVAILADGPYKLGDWIVINDTLRGQVTHVGMRSTRLRTMDDVEITIPNAMVANGQILNEMGGPQSAQRIRLPVSVAYGSDVPTVRRALLSATEGLTGLCAEPAPRAHFTGFGDSALNFGLLVWIDAPEQRDATIDALNERIYQALADAKLTIPFPQHDIWMRSKP
jgi:small-conductance mechanosensitive channel